MKVDVLELARKIADATKAGIAEAEANPEDGGSCNLDHVVITGLKHMRVARLEEVLGCRLTKGPYAGTFRLPVRWGGQGNQRYRGVQAQAASLKAAGVDCYVHYQID